MTFATFTVPAGRDAAIIARRRQLATISEIASEFELSNGRVSGILKRNLSEDERATIGHVCRHRAQSELAASLRDELLAELSSCGCPVCDDQDCNVDPWHCHGCGATVKEASQTSPTQRWVKGHPQMYCSQSCVGKSSHGARRPTSERVTQRRALVARAWRPDLSQAELAELVGIAQHTVGRDLAALEAAGEIQRRPARDVRAAALSRANERKSAAAQAALGEPGGCGSPTCRDPECNVPPGQCHQRGCAEPAAVAPQTSTRKRWVAGRPMLGCARHGPQWLADELREHRAGGLLTGREAAAWLGVADITPYVKSGALEPDERGRGGVLWFTDGTLKRFERDQARRGHSWTAERMDSFYRQRWLEAFAVSRGISTALAALEQVKARAAARQQRARGRLGGAPTKDGLRAELRAILEDLADTLDLPRFGRNEILAIVGERAWDERVDDFRDRYPAAVGGLDLRYRKRVVERVGRLIGDDVKALQTAAT